MAAAREEIEDGPARPESASAALASLLRWEASGAPWRVITHARSEVDGVEVELLTCTGGEVVEIIGSNDADLLAFLAGRLDPEAVQTGTGDPEE